jgi:short-subunit dehydrogenase
MNIARTKIAPKPFWLSAEAVVDASLRALAHDKLFVIPGWRYKLVVNLIAILPLSLRLFIESRASTRR